MLTPWIPRVQQPRTFVDPPMPPSSQHYRDFDPINDRSHFILDPLRLSVQLLSDMMIAFRAVAEQYPDKSAPPKCVI